jgi:hypothetical protein
MVAPDGRVLEGAVHPLDLTVRPRVVGLGQPVLDAVLRAGVLEGVGAEDLAAVHGLPDQGRGRGDVAGRPEVLAVVGQHGVHAVGHGREKVTQEVRGDTLGGALVELGEGEFAGTVDRDEEVKLALLGPDLGDVEVEEADRVGLEALAGGLVALGLGQAGDAVALEAAVERRARQVWDGGLERVEAVIERQEGVAPEGDNHRFLLGRERR